jgi:hypothetical protein
MNPPWDWLMVAAIPAELPLPREGLAGTTFTPISAHRGKRVADVEMLAAE